MLIRCAVALLAVVVACYAEEVKTPIDCAKFADGLYLLNENACTTEFWKCANRRTFMFKCPSPLWFNIETAACDYRKNVKTCAKTAAPAAPAVVHRRISYSSYQMPSGPIAPIAVVVPQVPTTTSAPVDFDCSNKANGYYYKRPCDTAFYSCAAYIAFKFECPSGTGYDPVDRACEHLSICGKPKPPTTTTTQAPVNVNVPDLCSTRHDGLHSQGQCQSQYILCSHAQTHILACPAQLVFDGETCTYLHDCLNPTTTQSPNTYQSAPPPPPPVAVATNSYQSVRPPPVAVAPQPTYQQSPPPPPPVAVAPTTTIGYAPPTTTATPPLPPPVAVNTPPPPSFCRDNNKPDGSYGSGCQNTFYLCSNSLTSVIECPSGLFYDIDTNTCDSSRKIVACGGSKPTTIAPPVAVNPSVNAYDAVQPPVNVEQPSTTQKPAFDCTHKPNGYYVNGCSPQYYSCYDGEVIALTCPSGLNYSPQTQKCNYAAFIPQCGGELPTTSAPVNVQAQSGSETSPSDSPNLNSVIEQTNGEMVTTSEEEGTNYCENLPNGIYGRRCSRHYFVCSGFKTYEFACPSGYAYNAKVSRCAPKTGMDVCTEQQQQTRTPASEVQSPINVAQPSGPYRRRI